MKKIVLAVLLSSALFAIEYNDEKLDSWRSGFITAYKAMEVDTQQQGLESKKMVTNKYIIYFDANGDDIAIWDKLMVQMFGYSASVHKPIRTTKDWIIFTSYDNKATALQELDILNKKIFKNSKRYKLQFFDNEKNEVFYNDKALLTSQLVELKELLKIAEGQKLKEKERELEENQKVALIYVNKATGEVVDMDKGDSGSVVPFVEPIVQSIRKVQPPVEKPQATVIDTVVVEKDRTLFVEHDGYVKQKQDDILLFSRPVFDGKYKVKTAKKGEVFRVESKNGRNWLKVKDSELYIAGHLVVNASENDYENFSKQQKKIKQEVKEKKKEKEKEKAVGNFTITADSIVLYKLKSAFGLEKTKYPLDDFVFLEVLNNDYRKYQYSAVVEDSDGIKYVKLLNENIFMPYNSLFLIK